MKATTKRHEAPCDSYHALSRNRYTTTTNKVKIVRTNDNVVGEVTDWRVLEKFVAS